MRLGHRILSYGNFMARRWGQGALVISLGEKLQGGMRSRPAVLLEELPLLGAVKTAGLAHGMPRSLPSSTLYIIRVLFEQRPKPGVIPDGIPDGIDLEDVDRMPGRSRKELLKDVDSGVVLPEMRIDSGQEFAGMP